MTSSIQEICSLKGISILSLSKECGIDFKRLQAICMNHWTPNPIQRKNIAQALDTEIADITWQHTMPVEHFYGPL